MIKTMYNNQGAEEEQEGEGISRKRQGDFGKNPKKTKFMK